MGEYAEMQMEEDDRRFAREAQKNEAEGNARLATRVQCPHCNAKPKMAGLADHIRDVHSVGSIAPQTRLSISK